MSLSSRPSTLYGGRYLDSVRDWSIDLVEIGYTLNASATGMTGAGSTSFNITP